MPLVVLTLCAAFAAHAVTAVVASSYLDPVSPRSVPVHEVQITPPPRLDGGAFVERNMFCSTCRAAIHEPSSAFRPDAILIATSIGYDARATIRVPASEVQGSWGVGEVVPGVGTIERIGFVSVDIADEQGRVGTLRLLDPAGGRSDAGAATPAPAAADPFADRIEKIDDHTFAVDRSLVRELVTGTAGTGGTRVGVVSKAGKVDGLRLFGVRPGSIANALGLHNGDVLQAVNDTKIESANTLLDLYAQLQTLNTVELAGTRGGKPLTITLRLR